MTLLPLQGHSRARARLARAVHDGRLPQAILISGSRGVGKQRLGLWLSQLALCEHPGEEPCGSCQQCQRVLKLQHPDLHWFIPVPRPKSSDAGKQVEEVDELLAAAIAERREQPLYERPESMASHGMASVRLLQRKAGLSSILGGRRIFLIGNAERLVVQESSQEAANALLKLLEEPPPGMHLILTAENPRSLLTTIRSRTAPVRLAPLANQDVTAFLTEHGNVPAREVGRRVDAAQGSIGTALAADVGVAVDDGRKMLEALLGPADHRWSRILAQAGFAARGSFTGLLEGVLEALIYELRQAATGSRRSKGVLGVLSPAMMTRMVVKVQRAHERAQGNTNPQLIIATLGADLALERGWH